MAPVGDLMMGVFLTVFGVGLFRYARPLANFREQIDAIGSTNDVFETEAAEWHVTLVRIAGAGLGALGVLFALAGFVR